LVDSPRTTKYAVEQQARRLRVAFDVLRDYVGKENRNAFVISGDRIEKAIRNAICELDTSRDSIKRLDKELKDVVSAEIPSDEELRDVVVRVPSARNEPTEFGRARAALHQAMDLVAEELSTLWDDERYVRAPLDEEVECD
jgi:chromosome segregation ATPase